MVVKVDQVEYIDELKEITLEGVRRQNKDAPVADKDTSQLR